MDTLTSPAQRRRLLAEGRTDAKERRERRNPNPQTGRGRPLKQSGIYYQYPILLDRETREYIMMCRIGKEPLGRVANRLIMTEVARKKVEALHRPNGGHVTDIFETNRHKSFDAILEEIDKNEQGT